MIQDTDTCGQSPAEGKKKRVRSPEQKARKAEMERRYRAKHADRISAYLKDWRSKNPARAAEAVAKWRKEHPEYGTEKTRAWRIANPEKFVAQLRRREEKNRESLALYRKEYRRKNAVSLKKKERIRKAGYVRSPQWRAAQAVRNRIQMAIRLQGFRKAGKTAELLGCDWATFATHIEKQFLPGMTWSNWGLFGWHIDHLQPLSSVDLCDLEQQKKVCNFRNLRPLWAIDNLRKGKKIIDQRVRRMDEKACVELPG